MKELSQKEKNNLFIYVMLFFTLAFIGWCFEVLNEIRKGHGFINRGVLHGPWLPIYGFGGLIIYILLKKYYKKPIIVFSLSFLISAVIEYFTSFYLEIKGKKLFTRKQFFSKINIGDEYGKRIKKKRREKE